MAEMPYLPVAPAIAAAVYEATQVWIDAIPMTPDRVHAELQNRQQRRPNGRL
jgi:CO/xanthine dehydrogenase Mo-binding subunit